MAHALTWLDVFTDRPLTGNGLAVVHDADDIDDATMLAFARETRQSETTFVQSSDDAEADYRNRIWMTTGELDFAGHPSLGTAVAVARARGDVAARFVQRTRAGRQPLDVELGERVHRATMLQDEASFGTEVEPTRALAAVGLGERDGDPGLPPQVVSTGLAHLLVPVVAGALERMAPDRDALAALLGPLDCTTAYVAACDLDREAAEARGFFLEGIGVTEDPATGSAAGPLMAYLHARAGVGRLRIDQGVALGRPSVLRCEAGERVRVAGDAVVVLEGTVSV
jgi:trans-2,3-dihydro-3-hydroxyanthranilate isomerase